MMSNAAIGYQILFLLSSIIHDCSSFILISPCHHEPSLSSSLTKRCAGSNVNDIINSKNNDITIQKKQNLLNLLSQVTPNQPTTQSLTTQILSSVAEIEPYCPTKSDSVLQQLNGNWELIWTAQDVTSKEVLDNRNNLLLRNRNWINPLENQSYSNNPLSSKDGKKNKKQGRSNPILPQNVQDRLEDLGFLMNDNENVTNEYDDEENNDTSLVRSSQAIDLKKGRVRNVVSVMIKNPLSFFPTIPSFPLSSSSKSANKDVVRGSLTVDVNFKPNNADNRKIDVKFNECRVNLRNSPLDVTIPLGPIGPTGWLRTTYIDDSMRITRGHKGSVFILTRTSKR